MDWPLGSDRVNDRWREGERETARPVVLPHLRRVDWYVLVALCQRAMNLTGGPPCRAHVSGLSIDMSVNFPLLPSMDRSICCSNYVLPGRVDDLPSAIAVGYIRWLKAPAKITMKLRISFGSLQAIWLCVLAGYLHQLCP